MCSDHLFTTILSQAFLDATYVLTWLPSIIVRTTTSRCERHGGGQVDGHLAERQRRQLPRRHGQRPHHEQRRGGADGPVSGGAAAAARREGRRRRRGPGLHADAAGARLRRRRRRRPSPLHDLARDAAAGPPARRWRRRRPRRRWRRQHLAVPVGVRSPERRLQRFL